MPRWDTLADFILETCTKAPHARVKASALYKAYKFWAMENEEKPVTQKQFATDIQERGYERKKMKDAFYYLGIGLSTDEPDPVPPPEGQKVVDGGGSKNASVQDKHGKMVDGGGKYKKSPREKDTKDSSRNLPPSATTHHPTLTPVANVDVDDYQTTEDLLRAKLEAEGIPSFANSGKFLDDFERHNPGHSTGYSMLTRVVQAMGGDLA